MNLIDITAEDMIKITQKAIEALPAKKKAEEEEKAKLLAETAEEKEKRLSDRIKVSIFASIFNAANKGEKQVYITCSSGEAGPDNLQKKVMLEITPELRKRGFFTLWKMDQRDDYEAFSLDELHISWDPKTIWHKLYG